MKVEHLVIILIFLTTHFLRGQNENKSFGEFEIDPHAELYGRVELVDGKSMLLYRGDKKLIENLADLKLDTKNHDQGYKIDNVQLKDLHLIINKLMPSDSRWKVGVAPEAAEVRVTGILNQNLMESLVSLMSQRSFYCLITDNSIVFKSSTDPIKVDDETKNRDKELSNKITIKPEFILSDKDLAKGFVELNGQPMGPKNPSLGPNSIHYSGNPGLLDLLRGVDFNITQSIELNNISLTELAAKLNSKLSDDSEWKVIVSDDAKEICVSGILDEDIVMSLTRLMHAENFYCYITKGIVEFKKGARSVNIVPLNK